MILDELLEMADAVAATSAAGVILVGDVIDLGKTVPGDIGNGEDIYWVVTTDTTFVAAGAGTIKFQLVTDAQAAIATDNSATVHIDTGTIVTAASITSGRLFAGGLIFAGPLPLEGAIYERYMGTLATIATQTVSAGKINSFLTRDPAAWKSYPDAVN